MDVAWKRWLLGFGIWTILALLSASQTAAFYTLENRPFDLASLVGSSLLSWYSCAIFTPLFFASARRWPVDRGSLGIGIAVQLLLCAVASALKFAIEREVGVVLLGRTPPPLGSILARNFISENIAFWCVAAAVHAIEFQRRARDREISSARLQARLSEAQLESLATRLQPHFLFNTLQAISTLVHRDPNAADAMLGHLSTLLRRILSVGSRHEVSLSEELAVLEEYLAIAQTRFGSRLTIVRDVAAEVHEAMVPYLVLQPLLENAFEHGIARKAGAGAVTIRAGRDGETLQIGVADDGQGQAGLPSRDGVGLGTTRARLAELYGAVAELAIEPRPGGGTIATLRIPWHTEPIRTSTPSER